MAICNPIINRMMRILKILFAILVLSSNNICWASPQSTVDEIDNLTRQILLKEISLERFNLHYSLEVAKQGRWKGWRYAAFQETNAGMCLAGAIIGTAYPGGHTNAPIHPITGIQETACYVPMIGSIIGASAAALEFGINQYHDYQASKKGFSPRVAKDYVLALINDITDLLWQREALVKIEASSPVMAQHAEIDAAEGRILYDLRDQGMLEFERFHIGDRGLLAFQQAQYIFDLSKYTLNAIGFGLAYLSLHRHDRKLNFSSGIMWDISGPNLYCRTDFKQGIWKGNR